MKWFFYLCRHTQTLLDSIKCSRSKLFALPAAEMNLLEHKEVPMPVPRPCPAQTLHHRASQWADFSPQVTIIITEMCAADAFLSPARGVGGSLGKPLKVGELPYEQDLEPMQSWKNAPSLKPRVVTPACTPGFYTVHTGKKQCVLFTGWSYRNAGLWYQFGQWEPFQSRY